MLRAFLAIIVCWLACDGVLLGKETVRRQPNIVLMLADDLGYSDLGCYGSEIATPNLDRLASEGMRFSQFYNAARCCPTRAALLTGCYPHAAGVGHMTADRGSPGYQGRLDERCVTIAEALRQSGYRTAMSGKWHVGESGGNGPMDRGFEHYFGLLGGASSYFALWPGRRMALDREPYKPAGDDFYMTDAITDHAVGYLENYARSDAPFFLYVAYTAPHAPLHARPEDISRYEDTYDIGWDEVRRRRFERMVRLGVHRHNWALSPRDVDVPAWTEAPDRPLWSRKMAVYAAQIDRMDFGIGRILDRLRELGLERDTLVMFLSDNGGCAEELDCGVPGAPPGHPDSNVGYGVAWANVSNAPFRRFKRSVHEGGIATPLIVRWPGVVPKTGVVTHAPGHVIDLLPTCLEAAGVTYPRERNGQPTRTLDGRSLLGAIEGAELAQDRGLFWEHEGNRAVRRGRWKLVARHLRPWELYDLHADRTELHDLAAAEPARVAELAEAYERWADRCGVVPWERLPERQLKREASRGSVKIASGEPQLFVDDWLIAESEDLKRTLHQPVKDDGGNTPVIAPMPGSATLAAKGSILRDGRLGRYVMFVKDLPSTDLYRLISTDGLHWAGEKGRAPERAEIDDRHPVTRVRVQRHQAGMHCFHYDVLDPEYPYKAWIWFGNWGPEHEGMYYLRSHDGLKWERRDRVVDGYFGRGDLSALRLELGGFGVYGPGDTTRFGFDPASGRFLGIFKFFAMDPVGNGNRLRSRAYAFINGLDQPFDHRCLEDLQLTPPAIATGEQRAEDEYYESNAWRYGSIWLGELLVWHERGDYPEAEAGCSYIKLLSSRDGLRWRSVVSDQRVDGPRVFLAGGIQGGNGGQNDGGHLSLFSQGPLRIGNELIFYYGASSWGKAADLPKRVSGGGIFRARLRLDGFVSVDSGSLTTPPLVFEGRELRVNAAGPVEVQVLGVDGAPCGRALIEGDSPGHVVTFDGSALRTIVPAGTARLRFRAGNGGRLYSFTIE